MNIYGENVMNYFRKVVELIVKYNGGYREKDILKDAFLVKSEEWNDSHKVIDIISNIEDADGHRDSFSIDIVTRKICG
jgi:hypothetical protein